MAEEKRYWKTIDSSQSRDWHEPDNHSMSEAMACKYVLRQRVEITSLGMQEDLCSLKDLNNICQSHRASESY